ncbi:TPA: bifunctional DNA primase/helicase [Escherichia coli]|nr:bifunctional DNA primase/helicase [Escherichia coli]
MSPSMNEVIDQFRGAMAEQGIETKDEIVADGTLHRIVVDGDKGARNGFYKLHADFPPNGLFGCNKRFGSEKVFKWKPEQKPTPMTPAESRAFTERMEKEKAEREAAMKARREAAAAVANELWNASPEASDDHPYLLSKGVKAHGLRVGKWEKINKATGEVRLITDNALLVPVCDRKLKIHSLQAIFPAKMKAMGNRNKDYQTDGAKRGLFHMIGKPLMHDGKPVFVLAEGYATAASIHECTGHCVLVCFDAGNLPVVAQDMKQSASEKGKEYVIVLAADNDRWTETPVANPGVYHAMTAAKAVNGLLVVPDFKSLDGKPTDFNDLHQREGAEAVRQAFADALNPPDAEPALESASQVEDKPDEPAPQEPANDNAANFFYISPEEREFPTDGAMEKLKASKRAGYLTQYYGAAYVSPDEARNIHVFDGATWVLNTSEQLEFDAAAMLKASGVDFDPNEVTNIIKVMRQGNRRMGLPPENIISFKNGVFDFDQNVFRSASPYDWQTTQNGIVWRDAEDGESLAVHAPNFHKWLSHAKYGSDSREEALLAALYMVLTCRYNWELAISLTGEGGAGKSVMQRICTMLSGEHNMAAIDIDGICSDFGLEHLLAKRLLIASEVAAKWPKKAIRIIKAMTGGDFVMVNRKGEKVVSALVRAIMIFTGNEAFDFGSVDSGLQRRIVHFGFTKKVPDEMKDDQLTEKIAEELPVVIRHLLQRFANPEVAKEALRRQRDGIEASVVKYEGNPLERFLSSLEIDPGAELSARSGMQWNDTGRNGTGNIRFERQFVYHAYLSFCDSEALKPSMDMAGIRRAVKYRFGDELKTGKGSQNRTLVNLRVRGDAEYLPQTEDQDNVINFSR